MDIEKQLKRAGLSKSEIRIYLYVLENGLSTPPQIAKGVDMARTNSYHILRSLNEKGLIEPQNKGKRSAFIATDPSAIVRNIEERKVAMESILPDLRALYSTQKNKPKIKFYSGWKEVKQIYEDMFEANEIFGVALTTKMESEMEDFIKEYGTRLKNKGITLKDLVVTKDGEKLAAKMKESLGPFYSPYYSTRRFDDIPTDLLIWNDSIALISLEQPIFGTVLTNKPLAQTFRILFELAAQNSRRE